METNFWATYRVRSPVDACDGTYFHKLYCNHMVATQTIESCKGNCTMARFSPQPTPELEAIASDLSGEEFLCPTCVEQEGGTHAYVLGRTHLRDKLVVMRPCFKYDEATVANFQDSAASDAQQSSLHGRVLPCLHIQHGVPSPYHILECGHTVKLPHGYPSGCAYNCAGGIEWDGILDCPPCFVAGTSLDGGHEYRAPRQCEYLSEADLAIEEMADDFESISVGSQSQDIYSEYHDHLLQCGHQITTNELANCCKNCSVRCSNIFLADKPPVGLFECKRCTYEMACIAQGVEMIDI